MTKYQKFLNIVGWVCVAMAVISALTTFLSGGDARMTINGQVMDVRVARIVAAILIAAVYLLLAWLCMRGAKDRTKAGPIRVLALIALILSVLNLLGDGVTNFSNWISVVVSGCVFFCANKVRKGE